MSYCKLYILVLGCFFTLWGCSSGEYDLNEYTINSVDKKVVVDTIKKVAIDSSRVKNNENTNTNENFVFVVQIGAFFNKNNFDAFFSRAKEVLGGDVYFVTSNNLYKIRTGNFSNKADALRRMEQVKALGYSDAFVITAKKQ